MTEVELLSFPRKAGWIPPDLKSRRLEPEVLDHLPVHHPDAVTSRHDLRTVNHLMGHADVLAKYLRRESPPDYLLDLGAGDGSFALSVCERLPASWHGTHIILLDRLPLATDELLDRFSQLGYRATPARAELPRIPENPRLEGRSVWIANLLLHHFDGPSLGRVLQTVATRANCFFALDPRRTAATWWATHFLRFLGCGAVTVHDGFLSVQAGFRKGELTRAWPVKEGWELLEQPAGLCSHLFIARRQPR